MGVTARIAEVRFQDPPLHLTGDLEAADHNRVHLAFQSELPHQARRVGNQASLVIPTNSVIYLAPATVAEASADRLSLNIAGSVRAIQRRKMPRVPYSEAVSIRVLRASDLAGAWFAGESVDLSVGGVQVRSHRTLARGMMVEIRMPLPASPSGPSARTAPSIASQEFWLRAKGRVVHARTDHSGFTLAGIQFLHLTTEDELRILDVVEARCARSSENEAQVA